MKGKIKIEDYKIHCIFGVYPHERKNAQEISIDLDLVIDVSKCVTSDSIEDTVNYEVAAKICEDLALSRQYHLLETFGFEALEELFKKLPLLFAKIKIKKKKALALAQLVSFELEKGKLG